MTQSNNYAELVLEETMEKENPEHLNLEEAYVGNNRGMTSMVDDEDLDDDDEDLDDDDLDVDVDEIDVMEGDEDEGSTDIVPVDEDIDDDLGLDEDDEDDEDEEL